MNDTSSDATSPQASRSGGDTRPMHEPPPGGWVLEVLDRQRRLAQRVRVTQWPLTVGRGYGANVQLDDPYLAAEHLRVRLDDDGQLRAEDCGTVNGVRRLTSRDARTTGPATAGTFTLEPGTWLECGRTRLRIVAADTAVAPERPLRAARTAPGWLCLLLALLAVGMQLWGTWFSTFGEFKLLGLVTPALTSAVLLLAWSGAWALLGRVLHGNTQFLQQLGWAALMMLATTATAALLDTLAFAFDWPVLSTAQQPLWTLAAAGAVLGHLAIAGSPPRRRSWGVLAGLCAASFAISTADAWQAYRQWLPETFMTTLRPVSWRVADGVTLEQLMQRAASDRAELDALRSHDSQAEDSGD
jgi:hypothetical protein